MSVKDALLEVQRGFALSDDVSLTQLRSSKWLGRLSQAHKLRLMWRNKAIGVVVEPAVWEAVQELVQDMLEDVVIEEIWGERIDHERIPASEAAPLIMQLLERHERTAKPRQHE